MPASISFSLAQQIVYTVKEVCGYNVNFIDCSGIIFASTDEKRIGTFHEVGKEAAATHRTIEVDEDNCFRGTQRGINLPVCHNQEVIAVIGISGPPDEVGKYALLAERITRLLIREKELYAFSRTEEEMKSYLIQAFIEGKTVSQQYLTDICNRWKIDLTSPKRLIILRLEPEPGPSGSVSAELEISGILKAAEVSLYAYRYPNEYLAVAEAATFERNAPVLKSFAENQCGLIKIAVGKPAMLSGLADSYESALTAIKSISGSRENYILFDSLTLEILLCAMDPDAGQEYLKKTIPGLTEEELALMDVYFGEDMSLNRTCQKLFLHKNTLQYRLDRIYKKTGYNPRKFKDAVLLYLALLIR